MAKKKKVKQVAERESQAIEIDVEDESHLLKKKKTKKASKKSGKKASKKKTKKS